MPWTNPAKIAFIGSHSVRKTNAVHAFASTIGRAGRSVADAPDGGGANSDGD